jgi:hypothetical protein
MSTVIAYTLVAFLVQFCLTGGVLMVVYTIARFLGWASVSLRTEVAGFLGGIAGVALAVAFGYGVFRILVGPDSYTLGAFVVSTLPLLIPIWNDLLQWQRVNAARRPLLDTIRESRADHVVGAITDSTETAHGSGFVGEIAGLALAAVWFFMS